MKLKPKPIFATLGLGVVFLLYIYPLSQLLFNSLASLQLESFFSTAYFWRIIYFTYIQASICAVLCLVSGLFFAVIYTDSNFKLKAYLWKLVLLPFSLPGILVVLILMSFWGNQGLLNQVLESVGLGKLPHFYGWWPIIIAHLFLNFSITFKFITTALTSIERKTEKAALSLGASRMQTFWNVTFIKLIPTLISAFIIVFLYCSTSFIIVLSLGGGPQFTTIEVAIYEAIKINWNPVLAGQLALFQMCVGLFFYLVYLKYINKTESGINAGLVLTPLYLVNKKRYKSLFMLFLSILILFPILSFVVSGFEFGLLVENKNEIIMAFSNTVLLASLTTLISVSLSLLLSYGASSSFKPLSFVIEWFSQIPLFVSTIILTSSWLIYYPQLKHYFSGSLVMIALVQSVGCLPLVYRPVVESLRRIPIPIYRSAKSLGLSDWKILFFIELPLIKSSLILASLIAFSYSVGELGSVMLLVGDGIEPLSFLLYRYLSAYQLELASVVGIVLLIFTFVAYFIFGYFNEFDSKKTSR